ncbi:MAG: hypothetical protein ACSHX6_00115 [Akkermansiaceae bacterium]
MKYINYLRITLITSLFTVVLTSTVFAQNTAKKTTKRTAQILYFKAPKEAPKTAVIYHAEAPPLEVTLPRNNFSSSIELAPGEVVLRFVPSILAEDTEFPQNAPSIRVPKGWKKILILAFNDPQNPVMPIRFEVVNANPAKLGPGDRMFINFTNNRVFGKVGSKKLTLKAKSTAVIKNAAQPNEEYNVQIDRVDPNTKKRLTFIRQMWRHSARRRSLILIYSPAGSTSVTYYNAPIRDL